MASLIDQNTLAGLSTYLGSSLDNLAVGDSRVVWWNGNYYYVQNTGQLSYTGIYYIVDVTDSQGLWNAIMGEDVNAAYNWIKSIPGQIGSDISSAATAAANTAIAYGQSTADAAVSIAKAIGDAIAAGITPVIPSITPLLVIAGIGLLIYLYHPTAYGK